LKTQISALPTAAIERALVAYAVLGDQIQAADMYEGLWEFIRPILQEKAGSRFVPSEAINWLRERYALDMPVIVLSNLAERLVKAGILEKAGSVAGAASYIYATPTSSSDRFSDGDYARSQEILKSFRDFVGRSRPLPLPHPTQSDLDNAFFQRLLHIESLSILAKRDNYITGQSQNRSATV
jgi:hypothetical protein